MQLFHGSWNSYSFNLTCNKAATLHALIKDAHNCCVRWSKLHTISKLGCCWLYSQLVGSPCWLSEHVNPWYSWTSFNKPEFIVEVLFSNDCNICSLSRLGKTCVDFGFVDLLVYQYTPMHVRGAGNDWLCNNMPLLSSSVGCSGIWIRDDSLHKRTSFAEYLCDQTQDWPAEHINFLEMPPATPSTSCGQFQLTEDFEFALITRTKGCRTWMMNLTSSAISWSFRIL